MDDSSSSQPAKCPCGFWGSSKTLGLCSRCYQDHLQKSKEELDSSDVELVDKSSNNTKSDIIHGGSAGHLYLSNSNETASSLNLRDRTVFQGHDLMQSSSPMDNNLPLMQQLHSDVLPQIVLGADEPDLHKLASIVQSDEIDSDCTPTNSQLDSLSVDNEDNSNNHNVSGLKRSRSSESNLERTCSEQPEPQKSSKRCFKCSRKLTLAQRDIGKCKCNYVFCQVHRMPEQHNCNFDHKEDGRQEQKKKMVKPHRHVGTSCRRIDSDTK